MKSSELLAVASLAGAARASRDPAPISLPASEWLGIDGNWSTVKFDVGSPSQSVNVLISNALSEFWVVGNGGCAANDPKCISGRGGIYTPSKSDDWSPLGTWDLDVAYGLSPSNGDYGQTLVSVTDADDGSTLNMIDTLTATVNKTELFIGYYGLGIKQGRFSNEVVHSPMTDAVNPLGLLPSYSYGYTAGASYRNVPVSATLGGYDKSRFAAHNIDFALTQSDGMPKPLVRGIQLEATDISSNDLGWPSLSKTLSDWDSTFIPSIDSTTPFLWLPEKLCDNLASALDLQYNSTFDTFVLTDLQYMHFLEMGDYNLTFSLSSPDNNDNYGNPLTTNGVVNITIPLPALVGNLRYPYEKPTLTYGSAAIPYLAVRKASDDNFILGRSFLQESYLITKFDELTFSIHQAVFPNDPESSMDIIPIEQPGNSPYPPPDSSSKHDGLSDAEKAGIAVGVTGGALVILVAWLLYRRRRNAKAQSEATIDASKDSTSSLSMDSPKSPIVRMFSKIIRRKRSRRSESQTTGEKPPAEIPDSEIYEMPAPLPPVELDASDGASLHGEGEMGLENAQTMSSYEQARRKMDRLLQGPVPAYSPPADGQMPSDEKAIYNIPQTSNQRRAATNRTSASPPVPQSNSDSLPGTLPSPVSPRDGSNGHSIEAPSPIGGTLPPFPPSNRSGNSISVSPIRSSSRGRSNDPSSTSRSDSDSPISPVSTTGSFLPGPGAAIQRAPIDPSKVICLGPLPENVSLPRHETLPPTIGADGANASATNEPPSEYRSEDTFGSNYTEDEQRMLGDMTKRAELFQRLSAGVQGNAAPDYSSQAHAGHSGGESDPDSGGSSQERINPDELVHVPQMAARRYSWEETL